MEKQEQFTDELKTLSQMMRKLKVDYPQQWVEVCKRAVMSGEKTVNNAYSALQSAVYLSDEISLEKQLQEINESAAEFEFQRLQTSLKSRALLDAAIESLRQR